MTGTQPTGAPSSEPSTEPARGAEDRPRATQSVAGVERTLDVLSQFITVPEARLGVTELAERLGMSKAVVHRILVSCRGRDWLSFDDATKRYRLGPQALHLGLSAVARLDLGAEVRTSLQRLSDLTGETATHSVRVGFSRVYVDQSQSSHDIRMVVQLGSSHPLHAGSSGKAILAFQPEEFREGYLLGQDLTALTPATPTTATGLREELVAVRARGWATSLGERQVGAASVAAPVLDRAGSALGVLSVCGPHDRVGPRLEEFGAVVLAETTRLAARLGYLSPGAGLDAGD